MKIGAFNVQCLGGKKINDPVVVDCLIKIIIQYDVMFIQEIRDKTGDMTKKLLELVNGAGAGVWDMVLSDPLSFDCEEMEEFDAYQDTMEMAAPYEERYAYFYKTISVPAVEFYQWPKTSAIAFKRPPLIVRFRPTCCEGNEFGFIGIHVQPDNAVREISNLADVYYYMKECWELEDFVIGGDFNAGKRYVKKSDWNQIKLRTDRQFKWIIGDDTDSTTRHLEQAYDRFVLAGTTLQQAYVNGSGRIFNYESYLNVTNDKAKDVSDHYPIEFQMSVGN